VQLGLSPALAPGKGIESGAGPEQPWGAWLVFSEAARSVRGDGVGHLWRDFLLWGSLTLFGF